MLHIKEPTRPVRVVIVDDVQSIRMMIRVMLQTDPRIEVVGEAGDPYEAREMIKALNPDVITLDVVMPRMDGLDFLERLMRLRPMPVVMVSTRTTERSQEAVLALSLGAVDCVDLGQLRQSKDSTALAKTVCMAADSNIGGLAAHRPKQHEAMDSRDFDWNGRVVLIGSSTGGVDALLQVLSKMPPDGPPVLIAQHMPPTFLESFATRLERHCAPKVSLSHSNARLDQGQIYLAAGGDAHAVLSEHEKQRIKHVPQDGSEPYVPSVNLLFRSGIEHGANVVGVMLTGMGNDGAQSLLEMREAGSHTIVQDSASSVIDGMPRAARELGAAEEVASLSNIADRILANTSKSGGGENTR
ncbi:MAG: chemotaxis-specific protein-glutamate methyltransferase CheB [Pseudomonadota bacterium]